MNEHFRIFNLAFPYVYGFGRSHTTLLKRLQLTPPCADPTAQPAADAAGACHRVISAWFPRKCGATDKRMNKESLTAAYTHHVQWHLPACW